MDVALEKRVRGRTNNYFAFTLEDARMLEGCIEYYENILKCIDLIQDDKLIDVVKRNMIDVYGMLGKIYYYLWEDEQSNISFQYCKTLLDEIIERNNGFINPNYQEWIFECLLSKIIQELNSSSQKSESLITMIDNYVETFGDRATKDYVNMSDRDFVKTISQQTNCDMQSIKQFLQFSKIKYFKSILNDDALVSSISNGIEFVKLQTNHALSVAELEFHFGVDEFYSRLGAILTNLGKSTASSNYNHSLLIRKNFFLRTLMNRIIDYQNCGMDGSNGKTLLFALYYYLLSLLEAFKFGPLPSILIAKEPFIYINHLTLVIYEEIEQNFPVESYDQLSSNIKNSAEILDKANLLLYKRFCLELLKKNFSNDETVHEDLKTIQMLEDRNEEEKYLSLQIPSIKRHELCDVTLLFHE
ncbi:predicted protein [Naegleria gruberi]|uniref:Predicted protein n=1 Tax=Naegleria gruberi TaxID=5762 RepID=D2VSS6_NAEGR|nr:uncharacterized protein NAEGRDRAFT_72045 [Naegleria gruberi]EFC40247.1 predicted protein [Naegleria gruberi]|eukprot:XP_002672991.1 predicted protein [Naegleria gruberi strain NEG-M]